jgi:hypothetical protein
MINNERVGWWLGDDGELLRPDPSNLYRFVGNDPTNCTDPTGLGEQPKKAAVPNTDYKSYTWRRTSKGGLIANRQVIAYFFPTVHRLVSVAQDRQLLV